MRFCWYSRRNENHEIGANITSPTAVPPSMPAVMNHHHDRPARYRPNTPLAATSMAVPKSGCSRISPVGRPISSAATIVVRQPGGSGSRCRYQASIIGSAIFSSSEGCR